MRTEIKREFTTREHTPESAAMKLFKVGMMLATFFVFAYFATPAFAQENAPAAKAAKASGNAKKTTVNFEDQLVEGQTQKPELFYLLQQRNTNFKRLIRLRENFLPEMRQTSDDVGRSAKGN